MSLLIEKALSHLSRTVDLVPVEIDESVVYVTELSKQTLNSYVGKAAQSVLFKGMEAGHDMGRSDYKAGAKKVQKGLSRGEGIKKAAARLTKEDIEDFIQSEEFDQLDELSKQTLGSYISKSAKQAKALSGEAGYRASRSSEMARTGNPKSSDVYANLSNRDDNKAEARLKGINKAIKKLAKEDIQYLIDNIDQLDESERYQLTQIALREDYTAKGNIYHGGEHISSK